MTVLPCHHGAVFFIAYAFEELDVVVALLFFDVLLWMQCHHYRVGYLCLCCVVANAMSSLSCLLLLPWHSYCIVITVALSLHYTVKAFLSICFFQDDMFRCWWRGKIEWKCIYPVFPRTFSTLQWQCRTVLRRCERVAVWCDAMEEWDWYKLVNMTADWVGSLDDQREQHIVP